MENHYIFMGKSTISVAMLSLPEATNLFLGTISPAENSRKLRASRRFWRKRRAG